MEFGFWDILVFMAFVIGVITLGLVKSRHEKTSEDYFLAGRGLKWWLVGFSLIAANISTEQFVGMSGNAASHVGLAIASYEWMAAITLVIVGFFFLPYFLRAGIFTIPEFLEYRYNGTARTIMALATIGIYMLLLGAVTYSGALTIKTLAGKMGHDVSLMTGSLIIGIIAMVYVTAGGLKACAWADLVQGSALILGGAAIMIFAFLKLGDATEAAKIIDIQTGAVALQSLSESAGPIQRFLDLNAERLNMFLPSNDNVLPWTALMLGLWIPNFYYWGLNQYITQRTLGSKSLAQGQKGIVFAASLKLVIPFVIVIPGMIAFNLYHKDMKIEAIADNATVIAKYLKANPNTNLVQTLDSPTQAQIDSWPQEGFAIAIFPDKESMKAVQINNYHVLPILKAKFDETTVEEYTIFESGDKAWQSTFPAAAAEIEIYNEATKLAAKAANKSVEIEKVIAHKYDTAMAQLLGNVLPQKVGLVGFVLAALLGAVVSSLAAMLNAASTIFSMDIYKKYISPEASQKSLVTLGRICVIIFTFIAIFLAPQLGNPKISNSIFTIIQESQGYLSPGILSVFVFGLLVRRGPAICGAVGLVTNFVVYGGLKYVSTFDKLMENEMMATCIGNFLNRMAISFVVCILVMTIITIIKPLAQPIVFQKNTDIDLKPSKGAKIVGVIVIVLTLLLYLVFSPLGIAK